MHGDIALCEAQHSAQAFFGLVGLGVPFPHDRYGAFIGYKTDHDPAGRATSAGPLTSRMMGASLGRAVCEKGFPVLDDHDVVALLWDRDGDGRRVIGAVALDRNRIDGETFGLVLFNARNVILATGGPGGMYAASVYPESQIGSTGLALAVGARAHNLTESQFGIASTKFRWNLSGSYQQVIPRYFSVDERGQEREFLNSFFPDMRAMASAVFRKGYEWPFDTAKVADFGSSLIDLLVYRETHFKKRRVFLDFRRNPGRGYGYADFSLEGLDREARDYLERSDALQETPIERLMAMNPQAVELYRSNGIDLAEEPLEIAVCAQHCNGGLAGNIWWESNVKRLFPVGEVNGTHGVRRPGGSALNAGQVGGIRAALYIARRCGEPAPETDAFLLRAGEQVRACIDFAQRVAAAGGGAPLDPETAAGEIRERMSAVAAHVRAPDRVAQAVGAAWALRKRLETDLGIASLDQLPAAFRAVDLCLTHAVYLEAIDEYLKREGGSRGSALVLAPRGVRPCEKLDDQWRFRPAMPDDFTAHKILEIGLAAGGTVEKRWVDIRPIPDEDGWFETVWRDFVKGRIVGEEE
jgi:succinate dehydrogenase/fumarate reductase flavoprotein subunit